MARRWKTEIWGRLDEGRTGPPPPGARRELLEAMREIARTNAIPADQTPSIGCSIKWKPGKKAERRQKSPPESSSDGLNNSSLQGARAFARPFFHALCARMASSSSATMLVILIAGFTAGPAVSL